MRKLLFFAVLMLSTAAHGASYVDGGIRYSVSDYSYSVSNYLSGIPSGCSLVNCSSAKSVLSNIGVTVSYAFCNGGVYSPYTNEICTIDKGLIKCSGGYLPVDTKGYLLLACPLSVTTTNSSSVSLDGYACFIENGDDIDAKLCVATDDGSGWMCPDNAKCDEHIYYTCDSGYTYNSSTGRCEAPAAENYICPAGTNYNFGTGKCEADADILTTGKEELSCSSNNYKYAECSPSLIEPINSISLVEQYSKAGCSLSSSFGVTSDKKKVWVDDGCRGKFKVTGEYKSCPSGYEASVLGCYFCPSGTVLNVSTKKCEATPTVEYYCPSAGTLSGTLCYKTATKHVYYTCPLGSSYSCMPVSGQMLCSQYACAEVATDPVNGTMTVENATVSDTPEGATDKKADGTVDSSGMCTGWVYIFNGNDYRCRPAGIDTGLDSCCKSSSAWFGLVSCSEREKALAVLRNDGKCHEIGSYCYEKVLGFCVQKKKTYCCFSSKFARIVQEQGRRQLGISWGTPQYPNCRGFTVDEFQKLDFSKMDFSEAFADAQDRAMDAFDALRSKMSSY